MGKNITKYTTDKGLMPLTYEKFPKNQQGKEVHQ